jgi:hypothetical protein
MTMNTNLNNSYNVALVEELTRWWTREMENRECTDGWDIFLVTFQFEQIHGSTSTRLKEIQNCVCRFYSKLLTRVVRKPRSRLQLHLRPKMLAIPDYPVAKPKKMSIRDVTINDGLHVHAILGLPHESRLKEWLPAHVERKKRAYIKRPLSSIHFEPVTRTLTKVVDYSLKSIKRGRCRWEDVLILPKSPSEL